MRTYSPRSYYLELKIVDLFSKRLLFELVLREVFYSHSIYCAFTCICMTLVVDVKIF